jgi:hypothetical protein
MTASPTFSLDEIENEFRRYWQLGNVREDWNAWADLFTDNVVYHERVLGTMNGRESVRSWIMQLMSQYTEIYGVYEWHHVDPSGRVVFYMQNRRDLPQGGYIDFPGISILQYNGEGLWNYEEDYWAINESKLSYQTYKQACVVHDPNHRAKRSRLHWGTQPSWASPHSVE